MELIRTINLSKVYQTEDIETTALNKLNLSINEGEFVAVMGPSGCGKTTLLNLIGLLDTPTSGGYFFQSINTVERNERSRAALRKLNIGFIFQDFNLIKDLNVFDNVLLPLQYLKMSNRSRKEKVNIILEQLEIISRCRHYPSQLSGGQQQRVAIARALIIEPSLIIADEPTGNLDYENSNLVMQTLVRINSLGKTILMVTHDATIATYAKRVVHLKDGMQIEYPITK